MSLFKNLGEKKRQLDNLISVANGIKDLKSEYMSNDGLIHIVVNSDFHIETFFISPKYLTNDDLKELINHLLDDMKQKINNKTQEILNSKHN